jgi:AcrR family transcriptional regulator
VTVTAKADVSTTHADWLRVAMETLLDGGVDRVKVLTLTDKLGASRSSFYWFFKNRDDLLKQLLDVWRQKNTAAIVARAERPADTITGAVLNVFECWIDERIFDVRLDRAIRDWARNDINVADEVRQADTKRIDALCAMFARQGFPAGEDFIRARVLYLTQIGYYAIEADEDLATRLSYLQHYMVSLTGRHASEDEIVRFASRHKS